MSEEESNTYARPHLRREKSQNKRNSHSFNSGEAGLVSKNAENQPQRSDRAVGSDNGWELRVSRLGGIHRRVKQLQAQHLAYVEAHGQRLEVRLQENREHKSEILKEIAVLEKELLELIEEATAHEQKEE